MSNHFLKVIQGDELFAPNGQRIQTLTPTPRDGTVMVADSSSRTGFSAYTPSELVNIAGGGLNILTTKGDLPVRDSTTTVRFPVGLDGYVLQANSATATGLDWVLPSAAAGDENPTVGTIAKRSGALTSMPGSLQSVGLITSGNIVATTTGFSIGQSLTPFSTAYVTSVNSTTVTATTKVITPQIESTGTVVIESSGGANLIFSQSGVNVFYVDGSFVRAPTRVFAADIGFIVGPANSGVAGASFKFAIDSSGATPVLVIQRWNGSAYVNYSVLA